jgi:nitronate monooxygenase
MIRTRFTDLVGCEIPLQQAGMAGLATPEMAAAVTRSGALGMVGWVVSSPEVFASRLDEIEDEILPRIGVNFIVPFLNPDSVAVAAERVRLVEFFYGDPDPKLVEIARTDGALACWQVGSSEEARAAADAGCDLVVAQAVEAGGHVRGTIALLPLLDAVLGAIDVPVVAAGGIGTGRAMAAALTAGADAVRVGTRFVAAVEADVHPGYQAALAAAGPGDTVLTEAFSQMWPNAPQRVLRSSVEAAAQLPEGQVGQVDLGGAHFPVVRYSAMFPDRSTTGRIDAMALYAGMSVGSVVPPRPAADIVAELASEAEKVLRERPPKLLH